MGEKRVVIVGNGGAATAGALQPRVSAIALSRFIDRSDVVIRLNMLNNLGTPGIGSRTDILAVNNCGQPGRQYAQVFKIASPILRGLREILVPVPDSEIARWAANPRGDPDRARDWSADVIAHQHWEGLAVTRTSDAANDLLLGALARCAGHFCIPTTGLRVINHVLAEPRFAGHAVYIVDFHFDGCWGGHTLWAERRYVDELIAGGRIRIVPPLRRALRLPARIDAALAMTLWPQQRRPRDKPVRRGLVPTSPLLQRMKPQA